MAAAIENYWDFHLFLRLILFNIQKRVMFLLVKGISIYGMNVHIDALIRTYAFKLNQYSIVIVGLGIGMISVLAG
ncbi:MAG: hypothetical protein COW15_04145 [Shewanella sp. CG12_big_fil_rev_8_21_14_0_65_47_15]|nr:MAG: hypothetical protein COW15_04145 [Shewanella sp. CG12_big_fil_rev_8_21_14_0_65_47_15]